MKNAILSLIAVFVCSPIFADCDAYQGGFYEYVLNVSQDLVLVGEVVEEHIITPPAVVPNPGEDGIPSYSVRMSKVRVDEIWCGEIIMLQSEDMPKWAAEFTNTSEFIWFRSFHNVGSSFSFWEQSGGGTIPNVITTRFIDNFYGGNACAPSALAILEDESLHGTVYWDESFGEAPYSKDDLKNRILEHSPLCKASGLNDLPAIDASIYPIPAQDLLNISIQEDLGANSEIILTNAIGQQVFLKKGINSNELLDISALQPGIYFLEIRQQNQRVFAETVLKN